MTISYPIDLPTTPGARRVTVVGSSSSALTVSPWTGSQQIQENQAQLWRFSLEFPPMSSAQARAWMGALLSLRGMLGTFYFGDKVWRTPAGTWAGSPVISGAGQSGATLNAGGFTAAATGKAGDYLQLGSASLSRLHMVTQDFVADGAGLASIEVFPALRTAPLDAEAIVTTSPKGIFRLASPDVTRSFEPFVYGVTFDIIEALTL